MKKLLLIFSITFLAFSCDKVDCPNESGCVQPDCSLEGALKEKESETTSFEKQVIFEFTGYKCNNCPEGAEEIASLIGKMGDTIIPISVHSGYFAIPEPDGGKYVTDFRTTAGDELEGKFLPQGYPTAVINLKQFDNKYQQGRSIWETLLRSEIDNADPNPPSITLKSSYSEESNTMIASAKIKFNNTSSFKHNLMFLLIEDGVIDVQLYGVNFLPEYEHKHVLRTAFGKTFGEKVNTDEVSSGDEFEVETSCFKLNKEWNLENCEVVGVLYKINSDNTFEVVQAQIVHVK